MELLSKFVLAHLLGDFLLQPHSWVKAKEEKGLRSWQIYIHSIIHGVLILFFIRHEYIVTAASVSAVTHLLIDFLKLSFQKDTNRNAWFAADQLLHLTVITILWIWLADGAVPAFEPGLAFFVMITAAVFLTTPTSFVIRMLISRWSPESDHENTKSLQDAGKFIGILERLFILAFLAGNHWEAVGFLLAAKSVFRFGDLKDAHDRKLTEYVMIGTLLSFGIAMATGLAVSAILSRH